MKKIDNTLIQLDLDRQNSQQLYQMVGLGEAAAGQQRRSRRLCRGHSLLAFLYT